MQEWVICKTCGYIMDKRKLKDLCPACGVPAKMFEPYSERISPVRKRILKLDLHPIVVHFAQAFSVTIPLLCGMSLLNLPSIQNQITATITVLGVALPFAVLLSFLAGLLDGKIRFRKVTTPLLKAKIIFGTIMFLLACAIALAAAFHPSVILIMALSAPAVGCATCLGLLGVRLLNSAFPG